MNKNLKSFFKTSVIIVIIIFLYLFLKNKSCNRNHERIIDTIIYHDTNYHLQPIAVVPYNYGKTVYKDRIVFIDKKIKIHDTEYIYNDYLTKRVYLDTILNNRTGFISIIDTLQANRILSRETDINIYPTKEKPKKNNYIFIGIGSEMSNEEIKLNFNVGYKSEKNMFSVGINNKKEVLANYYRNLIWKK